MALHGRTVGKSHVRLRKLVGEVFRAAAQEPNRLLIPGDYQHIARAQCVPAELHTTQGGKRLLIIAQLVKQRFQPVKIGVDLRADLLRRELHFPAVTVAGRLALLDGGQISLILLFPLAQLADAALSLLDTALDKALVLQLLPGRRPAGDLGALLPVFGLAELVKASFPGRKHLFPAASERAPGAGVYDGLCEKCNVAVHLLDGGLQLLAVLFGGVGAGFVAICAALGAGLLALHLLGKAQALARLPGVRQADMLCAAARGVQVRDFRAADPAAGFPAPQEIALDFGFLLVGQFVIGGFLKVQLQLAGLPVDDEIIVFVHGVGSSRNDFAALVFRDDPGGDRFGP